MRRSIYHRLVKSGHRDIARNLKDVLVGAREVQGGPKQDLAANDEFHDAFVDPYYGAMEEIGDLGRDAIKKLTYINAHFDKILNTIKAVSRQKDKMFAGEGNADELRKELDKVLSINEKRAKEYYKSIKEAQDTVLELQGMSWFVWV